MCNFDVYGLRPPNDILRDTFPIRYNEITLIGAKDGDYLRVSGVFIKVDVKGEPLASPRNVNHLKGIAKNFGLPVVYLMESEARLQFSVENVGLPEPYQIGLYEGDRWHVIRLKDAEYSCYSLNGKWKLTTDETRSVFGQALKEQMKHDTALRSVVDSSLPVLAFLQTLPEGKEA